MLIARWCCLLTSYSRKAKDEDGRRVLRPGRIVLSLLLFLAGSSFFFVFRAVASACGRLSDPNLGKKKKRRKKKIPPSNILYARYWCASSGSPRPDYHRSAISLAIHWPDSRTT